MAWRPSGQTAIHLATSGRVLDYREEPSIDQSNAPVARLLLCSEAVMGANPSGQLGGQPTRRVRTHRSHQRHRWYGYQCQFAQ